MRVACITRHRFPTPQEVRVSKISECLTQAGHKVFVYCPGAFDDSKMETSDLYTIRRLISKFGSIGSFLFAPLPINPLWVLWFCSLFRSDTIDLVIVRDLRLFAPALGAAKLLGIPIILDIGEHYPGMMEILGVQHWTHHLTRNQTLIKYLETWAVRNADHVFVVVEENKSRLSKLNTNIEVIANYAPSKNTNEPKKDIAPKSTARTALKVVFVGLIDNIRGLDTAIDAMALLNNEVLPITLEIYGDGPFRSELEARVKRLALTDKVFFGGWVNESDKQAALLGADIGIILHKVCDLTEHTQPNKLFEYMRLGVPILATRMRPVARIVSQENCGLIVNEDANDIAGAIKKLAKNENLRAKMSQNGIKAIQRGYKWRQEALKLQLRVESFMQ